MSWNKSVNDSTQDGKNRAINDSTQDGKNRAKSV